MNCNLTIKETALTKALSSIAGANMTAFYSYYGNAIQGDNFKPEFKAWYKDKYEKEPNINAKAKSAKDLASAIIEYYAQSAHSVNDTSRNDKSSSSATTKGYVNEMDREDGKRHSAVIILNDFNEIQNTNSEIKGNKLNHYKLALKNTWDNSIINLVANKTNKSFDVVKEDYFMAEDKFDWIDRHLDKENVVERNLAAVWKEINGSDASLNNYINEVFSDTILQNVLPQVKDNLLEDYNEELSRDEDSDKNEESSSDNPASESTDDVDDYIGNVTNHIGAYNSFMKHVGPRIINYFNSLPILSTTDKMDGEYNLDTNNRFGMPTTMDAKACTTMLINCGVFNNIDTMIDSIRRIADNVRGFEGFAKFADDLGNNTDFATEVFTVFAKESMKRAEVVLENNRGTTKVSNERANADSALFFDLYNDLKGSVVDINHDYALVAAKDIKEKYLNPLNSDAVQLRKNSNDNKALERFNKDLETATLKVGSLLMQYFPSVQLTAIQSYVKNGFTGKGETSPKDKSDALDNLHAQLTYLISKSPNSYMNYLEMESDAKEMARENTRKSKGVWSDKQIISYKDIYNREYIYEGCNTNVIAIKDMLLPYTVVNTDFNTRNVYGNNSSSIINSSLITRINKMLNATYKDSKGYLRNKQLEEFATDLIRSKQYKYDNLLFTQYDENGNAINDALFSRDENGGLFLNQNYRDLFDVYLYDGASNIDEGNNVDYTKSTIGDFLPSQFIAYFANKDRGNYFLRTPSDAPKTFCIKGPKYYTGALFEIKDMDSWKSNWQAIGNDFERISAQDYYDKYKVKENSSRDKESIINAIIGKGKLFVPSLKSTRKHGDKDVYIMVDEEAPNESGYIFEGKLVHHETYTELGDYEFVGVVGKKGINGEIQQSVENYFADKLRSEDVTYKGKTYARAEYKINRNNNVYMMIRNQFKQEMLNAAIALDHYFETRTIAQNADGTTTNIVDLDTTKDKDGNIIPPKFKPGMNNTTGYKFYHLGSDGKVLSPVTTGNTTIGYRLNGNVFKSTKFTVNKVDEQSHVNPTNYLQDAINQDVSTEDDGKIHFLYGGDSTRLRIIKDADGKVTDVAFTDNQMETINSKLDEFLLDYADDCFRRASQYKQFFKGTQFNFDTCTDFSINNLIMHYNYDTLFEGDTKFYKDSQTVLKRAKEYQGSGVPYGVVDYNERDSEGIHELKNSYLNNGTYDDTEIVKEKNADGKVVKKRKHITRNVQDIVNTVLIPDENGNLVPTKTEIKQRNKFYAVTIKNTQRTNDVALANLSKYLQDNIGMDKDAAETLLYGPVVVKDGVKQVDKSTGEYKRRGGFTDTKVNDAQSYITYEEWVRRIAARGQLQRYLPLIKKLNDPNSKLSGDDLKQFVQVQKNFYYDLYYDDRYGIRVPRQIKNAEFVLVPRLIKGTELEKVYKMMKEAGVDQLNTVETSKAANETLLTLWDDNEVLTKEAEDSFVGDAKTYRQLYSYNNLYTQQETPQHMNAQNKMGIQISKKIIDNLPYKNGKIDPRKAAYFKLISRNIYENYNDFCDEIDAIRSDDTGDVVIKDDGTLEGFDKKLFYDKFREELYRRGMDSNLADYVTLGEDGMPKMPSCMSNNLPVLESAMQAMINSGITRQKLPGFHAAQVTNVGFKSIHENGLGDVTYDTELRYHPMINGKPQPYIEVKLPASFLGIDKNSAHYKNMTDAEIIKELEDTGLDIFLGYRIPTEGKQSVCNMKVVGLLSDAYGSTIVVPNDWVSQTGSDFDIDSVYSIQYETYKTVDGQVKKIEYVGKSSTDKTDSKYEVTPNDYASYIRDFVDRDNLKDTKNKIQKARKAARAKLNERYKALNEAEENAFNEFINTLDEEDIASTINSFKKIAKRIAKEYEGESNNVIYSAQMQAYSKAIKKIKNDNEDYIKEEDANFGKVLDNLIDACDNLYKYLNNQSDNYTEEDIKGLEEVAKEAGLISYEDYKNGIETNPEQLNTRRARNNEIVNIMKDILMDDVALEENLSRSNFDKITEALLATMNIDIRTERNNRSPYNVFDQIAYQEDAMSGAKLKAFSVTLDTFCSVCNTVHPKLTSPIYVVYDTREKDDKGFKGFGTDYIGNNSIKHSMYGWNHSNRNVEGMILTSYSSQTTAYILDAIKEGAIPNVNDFTFAAFKTLANVGVDYKTSISFIMQPGVKRIVDAYNASKSIYSGFAANPVLEAVRGIAENLGIATDYKSNINTVLNSINARYKAQFNAIFKQEGDEEINIGIGKNAKGDIPIIASKLLDRLQGKEVRYDSRPVKDVDTNPELMTNLFDLGVILAFNKLNNTARQIGDVARCCNPDKFGAKQTVFATNKVFDDIHDVLYDEAENERMPVLEVESQDGETKNILESIYPGVSQGLNGIIRNDFEEQSTYPTLYSYLKYATATSIVVGRSVLETQSPKFVSIVNSLGSTFSGFNHRLDEATYNDFQKYVLTHYYNSVESIARPVSYSLEQNRFVLDNDGNVADERRRIYGYSQPASMQYVETTTDKEGKIKYTYKRFTVANPVAPTQEEIDIFAKLSPAQKVQWVKSTFEDAGVFNYIQAQLYNNVKRGAKVGMQTLEYTQERVNPNVMYNLFYKAFYNENPLISMAAFDVVKYAAQVEGFRTTARAVSKVIDNDVLMEDFGRDGTGFVGRLNDMMHGINEDLSLELNNTTRVCENYLRGHLKSVKDIKTLYLNKSKMKRYGLVNYSNTYGMLSTWIDYNTKEEDDEKARKQFVAMLDEMGVRYKVDGKDLYATNKYVKIKFNNKPLELYKIYDLGNAVILAPFNNLNPNEDAIFSAREDFNQHPDIKYYDSIVADFEKKMQNLDADKAVLHNIIDSHRKDKQDFEWAKKNYQERKVVANEFDINKLADIANNSWTALRNQLASILSAAPAESHYIYSRLLATQIYSPGVAYGSVQRIKLNDGKYRQVLINRVDASTRIAYRPQNGEKLSYKHTWNGFFLDQNISRDERDTRINAISNPEVKQIYKEANGYNAKNLNEIFEVTPYGEN